MQTLSIIIPAYNEEKTIGGVLQGLADLSLPGWEKQIIVINDGSHDKTEQALAPFFDSILYLRHPFNRGKGAAIRTAAQHVAGDAVLIQDADLEYHPEDIPALLSALSDERVHAVYGSRPLRIRNSSYPHYVLGGRFLTALVNVCFGSRLTDVYTCYKLLRTNAFNELSFQSYGFEYEMEVTVCLLKRRYVIAEVPIRYAPRGFHEGKKIRARDGLCAIATLVKHYLQH